MANDNKVHDKQMEGCGPRVQNAVNPISKTLKFKYLQIWHKACLSPFLEANWPQKQNLFHENPLTPRLA